MAVRPLVLYPDTRLKTRCASCDTFDKDITGLVEDLLDTMNAAPPRTVGIAAPQIGDLRRVCIVDTSRNPRYPGGQGLLVLVNPRIVARTGEQFFREGCLSLPQYTANIRRWARIAVSASDPFGRSINFEAESFEAVVLQHEIDHLDGILFLDRVANVKTDLFHRKARE